MGEAGLERIRTRFAVEGVVQGVGFRPFVASVAGRFGLAGLVGNDLVGVFVEVEGSADAVRRFGESLLADAPPLAVIERITATPMTPCRAEDFVIAPSRLGPGGAESRPAAAAGALVAPDVGTCSDCLRELFDPGDRRYRYPFVNCTNCGPRFTIIRGVPYDRARTTMADFEMCAECAAEYGDPADRRFHAQPTCCPACGPSLRLLDGDGALIADRGGGGDLVAATAELLRAGRIVAVKGLGGYHLAVDATHEDGVRRLRSRKHRADKPFALLLSGLAEAQRLCEVDHAARDLLTAPQRPIVVLPRRPGTQLASAIAPGTRELGVMLPYTPLHWLLAIEVGSPLVLTSGNVSDEPIAYQDDDAVGRLGGIADAFLTHDRPIHARTDDSVFRAFPGGALPLRRSRGYVPQALTLPASGGLAVLGCGADLKNTFCLARGPRAFLSPHLGDLKDFETFRAFTDGVERFAQLLDVCPELIVHDLHPDYLSTKYAHELAADLDARLLGVQHHHAHIASCLAEHGFRGQAIGVAFDGLGYGLDGTLWGGEFLLADLTEYRRVGHLAPVPLPGGAAAIREPWRMAAAYLDLCGADVDGGLGGLAVRRRNAHRWEQVVALARAGLNSPLTSSAGRLFDAVAAILGVRDTVTYEGQAAVELEQLADPHVEDAYRADCDGATGCVDTADLIRGVVADLRAGTAREVVAARFHNAVADVVVESCRRVRTETGVSVAALSGGVFQNLLLSRRVVRLLRRDGFQVLTHRRVPPNDGGISLGQVAIAAALGDRNDGAAIGTP